MADPREDIAPLPRRKGHSAQTAPLIAGAFALLAVLALYVTFFLAPAPPQPSPVATPAAPPAAVSAPAPPSAAEDPNKAEAERLLTEGLRRVARLDGEGVRR